MNLNIHCYDFSNELDESEKINGASFIIGLPSKVFKVVEVVNNNLYVLVDIDSIDQSYVKLTFVPPGYDIKVIDEELNNNPTIYTLMGRYELQNNFLYLFARVLTESEARLLDD